MNEFVLDPLARLFGEWSQSLNIYSFLLRIALAVFYGFIIGFERSSKRHSAGLRTFLLLPDVPSEGLISLSMTISIFFLPPLS